MTANFKKCGIQVIGNLEQNSDNAPIVMFERKTLKLCKPSNDMKDLGLSKLERKGRNRAVTVLSALFNGRELKSNEGNKFSLEFDPEGYFLINKSEYREAFLATSFKQESRILGGVYLCPWICGTEEQKKNRPFSLRANPIKEIVTGMCMFGDSLFGLDEQGALHPLTDARYVMPHGCKLGAVVSHEDLHPYEVSIYRMLENLVPLIKSISPRPKIVFHLPAPEYVLYGIKRFVFNQMSESVLYDYIRILKERTKIHTNFINEYAQFNDMGVEVSSPLDTLDLLNVDSLVLQDILAYTKKLKSIFTGTGEETLTNIESIISARLLCKLIETDPVWDHVSELNDGSLDLIAINNYSYCTKIAQTARKWDQNQVCILDDAGERPTATHYAKDFANIFGSVLALHWLPPMFVHDDKRNSMYFLGDLKKQAMIALMHGHAERTFHMIGNMVG